MILLGWTILLIGCAWSILNAFGFFNETEEQERARLMKKLKQLYPETLSKKPSEK